MTIPILVSLKHVPLQYSILRYVLQCCLFLMVYFLQSLAKTQNQKIERNTNNKLLWMFFPSTIHMIHLSHKKISSQTMEAEHVQRGLDLKKNQLFKSLFKYIGNF